MTPLAALADAARWPAVLALAAAFGSLAGLIWYVHRSLKAHIDANRRAIDDLRRDRRGRG